MHDASIAQNFRTVNSATPYAAAQVERPESLDARTPGFWHMVTECFPLQDFRVPRLF